MLVTKNAVEYLVAGAEVANNDINAVDAAGVEYDADRYAQKMILLCVTCWH